MIGGRMLRLLTILYYTNRLTLVMTLILTWTIALAYSTGMFMLISKLVH
jgi:hypothetical protein